MKELSFMNILSLPDKDPVAYQKLGMALASQGNLDEAIALLWKAIAITPDDALAHRNLGIIFMKRGDLAEAEIHLQRAVSLDPSDLSAKHLVAAMTGQTPETIPGEYVRELFDQYSEIFDHHLLDILEYHTPTLLRQGFQSVLEKDMRFRNVLDLGCGTGLAGLAFQAMADQLTGIDISLQMIRQARAKNIYHILRCGDILSFLDHTDESYDLFVASDVLVYMGNLSPVFKGVRQRSVAGAYFVFSTEITQKNDFELCQTGRFAHAASYIQSIAEAHGFAMKASWRAVLRKECGQDVIGQVTITKLDS